MATVSTGQQPIQVKLIASPQERRNFQEELGRADLKNGSIPILGWFSASRTRDGGLSESHLIEASSEALVLKLEHTQASPGCSFQHTLLAPPPEFLIQKVSSGA